MRAVYTSEGGAQGSTYIQHEGGTIPCTVKTMRQRTCTDRLYKANRQISFSTRMTILQVRTVRGVKYRTLGAVASLL